MFWVGNYTVVLLNHWDNVIKKHILETIGKAAAETTKTTEAPLWTLTTLRSLTCWAWSICVEAVIHHDNEWNGFFLCDEVVHDRSNMALVWPTVLVLTHTML